MGHIAILTVLLVSVHFCLNEELCPPSNVISPCTCDEEGINCMRAKTDSQLQRIFRSIPKPWKTRAVWIKLTDMTVVPAGMFQGIEVKAFRLEINKIHTVESGAFGGSEESLVSVSVFGNELTTFPWGDLKTFSHLRSFNAGRNKMTSIPQDAFSDNVYLSEIILAENKIIYVAPNAFHNLPSLEKLYLLRNDINVLGPLSFNISRHNPELVVVLQECSIASISPTAFTGITPSVIDLSSNQLKHLEEDSFLPVVKRMREIEGQIDLTENPLTCEGCSYNWIVYNKPVLKDVFLGFHCQDGKSIDSLTGRNIGCEIP